MTDTQQTLQKKFPTIDWKFWEPLAPKTYFKIGGKVEAFATISTIEDLQKLVIFCCNQNINLKVLGGGSNVLVKDSDQEGVVVSLQLTEVKDLEKNNHQNEHLILIQAGTKTALAVSKSVQLGYTGLEKFLGVPGTIGGAVYNNAHYLEDLMCEHIERVQLLSSDGKKIRWVPNQECDFGYDHSRFQTSGEIILAVEFHLKSGDQNTSREIIAHATQYRAQTQPLGIPSSGCIFQNTLQTEHTQELWPQFADKSHVPTGFIIDQAGLKGMRIGDVEVSDKHAAWIINHGKGTASDVEELIKNIKQAVKERFDVEIKEEIFYL